MLFKFFFFQAEDGIRDADVTGVQTCALPISPRRWTRIDFDARPDGHGPGRPAVRRDGRSHAPPAAGGGYGMSKLASMDAEQRGSWILLRLHGEIDISNAREIAAAIEAAVPNGTPRIAVDLTHVSYLDSAGVKLLMQLADRLRARRRGLRLIVPAAAPIRAVLELTGLPGLVPLEDHLDEGLDAPER